MVAYGLLSLIKSCVYEASNPICSGVNECYARRLSCLKVMTLRLGGTGCLAEGMTLINHCLKKSTENNYTCSVWSESTIKTV